MVKETTLLHYLSSPYNDPDPTVRERRRIAACRTAGELIDRGLAVLSPIAHNVAIIEVTRQRTGWDAWRGQDSALLLACQKVLVLRLPGWENSRGVAEEIRLATGAGIPVEYID